MDVTVRGNPGGAPIVPLGGQTVSRACEKNNAPVRKSRLQEPTIASEAKYTLSVC